MMTKRFAAVCTALLCAGVGVLRWLDLAGNTDPVTGFLLSGEILPRYLLLALPVLAVLLAGFVVPADVHHTLPAGAMVPAFCGMLFSGIIGISLFALQYGTALQLVAAILLALGCLWFAGYVVRPGEPGLFGGLMAAAGWTLVCGALFGTRLSSLHHMLTVLELLCCLGCLLQIAGLLHGVYAAGQKGISRGLFTRGMLGFYFGFCLLLPQEIWQWQNNIPVGFLQGKCVAAAALGITGLATALYCAFHEGSQIVDADDPEAVQAAFDDAGRRLEQMLAQDESDPGAPAGDERWRSAASTLYGNAAAPTPRPAPRPATAPQPAPVQAAPATPVKPAAPTDGRPVIVSDSAAAPADTAPVTPSAAPAQKPTAAPQPAAAPKQAAPQQASPVAVRAVPPTQPRPQLDAQPAAAQPSGTMERLDSLLAQLQLTPTKADSAEDILSDLNIAKPTSAASPAQQSPTDGEKWVFRR